MKTYRKGVRLERHEFGTTTECANFTGLCCLSGACCNKQVFAP